MIIMKLATKVLLGKVKNNSIKGRRPHPVGWRY